ncbi:MAG TPA: dihydrofolate reductase family protein [Ktedonobacterales bacterium]|nr:dihydrofolate reductase family protein [Ktedonobacterales bacterium]
MRKLIVSEFVTLDGVMQDPGGAEKSFAHGGWSMRYWHDEIGKVKFDELVASDTLLLGRVTYQGFAAAWPAVKDEAGFADKMNSIPKVVVSTTLETVEWNNSRLIKENVADEIANLKQQPGQDILVGGSATLVRTLMQHDLIDGLRLLVYPVVLGSGKRIFPDGINTPLTLVESRSFPSGVVLLEYQPAR